MSLAHLSSVNWNFRRDPQWHCLHNLKSLKNKKIVKPNNLALIWSLKLCLFIRILLKEDAFYNLKFKKFYLMFGYAVLEVCQWLSPNRSGLAFRLANWPLTATSRDPLVTSVLVFVDHLSGFGFFELLNIKTQNPKPLPPNKQSPFSKQAYFKTEKNFLRN